MVTYTGCNWKVQTNFGHKIHIPKQENISIYTCLETFNVSYSWRSTFIISAQNVLHEIQCMPWYVYYGLLHPLKVASVVTDSLTGIQNAIVKCLFIVNRTCIHKGFQVSPQVKIQRIQIWRAWRPCSGSSSTYPSVMIWQRG
jgi:hypothetical protein